MIAVCLFSRMVMYAYLFSILQQMIHRVVSYHQKDGTLHKVSGQYIHQHWSINVQCQPLVIHRATIRKMEPYTKCQVSIRQHCLMLTPCDPQSGELPSERWNPSQSVRLVHHTCQHLLFKSVNMALVFQLPLMERGCFPLKVNIKICSLGLVQLSEFLVRSYKTFALTWNLPCSNPIPYAFVFLTVSPLTALVHG